MTLPRREKPPSDNPCGAWGGAMGKYWGQIVVLRPYMGVWDFAKIIGSGVYGPLSLLIASPCRGV